MRGQVAGLPHLFQIQARGRELGDLRPTPRSYFHIEQLGPDHAANRTLVHGKEAPAYPVPSLVVMASIDAYHDLHLGLSPEARIVRVSQPFVVVEITVLILAVVTNVAASRLEAGFFLKIIVRPQYKPDLLRASHLFSRLDLHPLTAGADAIFFVLIRTHSAFLRDRQRCQSHEQEDRKHRRQGIPALILKRVSKQAQSLQGSPPA